MSLPHLGRTAPSAWSAALTLAFRGGGAFAATT